jgi:CSLREA domain-containing protein
MEATATGKSTLTSRLGPRRGAAALVLVAGLLSLPLLAVGAAPAIAAGPRGPLAPMPKLASPPSLPAIERPLLGAAPDLASPVETFTVNTTNDTDDAHLGDGVCADGAGNCSLRAAIEEANALGEANPAMGVIGITVPAGTYTLSLHSAVTNTYALVVTDPAGIVVTGAGQSATTVSGMPGATDRVFEVAHGATTNGANLELNNLTITHGSAPSSGVLANSGGGIAVADANDLVQLNGVTVIANSAGTGGGISTDGSLWATGSEINSNNANDTAGGPDGGGLLDDGEVNLTDTIVNNNTAISTVGSPTVGGGIEVSGSLTVTNGSISGNQSNTSGAALGGGLAVANQTSLFGVTLANNVTTGGTFGYGGAIYDAGGLSAITGGNLTGNSVIGANAAGGGIDIYFGDPTITATTIAANRSVASGSWGIGGGVATYDFGGVTLVGATVTANTVSNTSGAAEGGGIGALQDGAFTMRDSTVSNNTAAGPPSSESYGGGILSGEEFEGASVTDSTITGNLALNGQGGGLWDDTYGAELQDDTISANNATAGDASSSGQGGGLYLMLGGDTSGTTIASNQAGSQGGGLWTGAPTTLSTSTVVANDANQGGGLYVTGGLSAENDTIASNNSTGPSNQGGAIFDAGAPPVGLRFVTVTGNTANQGSAIYENASADGGSIASSIIQAGCAADPAAASFTSGGHNVLADRTCLRTALGDQVTNNPRLSTLGNYGGPTETLYPLTGSPAIGGGGTSCPPTDQRGAGRPQGVACDTGAVEVGQGYWEVASDGGIFSFGAASFFGSMGGIPLNQPVVGMASTPDARGYWEAAADGGLFAFGDAAFFGSMGDRPLNQPVVGLASTPDGQGYWEVASDGGLFAFGDAAFFGSMGGKPLNKPVVGMASTPDGGGYWEVASDGGLFAFGDAAFYGSMGGKPLNNPIVGIAATPDGLGYWEVASDGGIFSFGDATFFGSMGGKPLNRPVVAMAATPDGAGYWQSASDGGIFAFGDATFFGSMGAQPLNQPVVGMAAT